MAHLTCLPHHSAAGRTCLSGPGAARDNTLPGVVCLGLVSVCHNEEGGSRGVACPSVTVEQRHVQETIRSPREHLRYWQQSWPSSRDCGAVVSYWAHVTAVSCYICGHLSQGSPPPTPSPRFSCLPRPDISPTLFSHHPRAPLSARGVRQSARRTRFHKTLSSALFVDDFDLRSL